MSEQNSRAHLHIPDRAYAGPVSYKRLAANGLKYNRFHTTALCSPTRQALLTGRNHHAVGMGSLTKLATSAPGYSSVRPNAAAPLAETQRLNGYSNAQFGRCHEVPTARRDGAVMSSTAVNRSERSARPCVA